MATLTSGGITYSDGTLTNSAAFNGVGSYVWGYTDSAANSGTNYAAGGSGVRSGAIFSNCGTFGGNATTNLSGTWRCMGSKPSTFSGWTLFVRVA